VNLKNIVRLQPLERSELFDIAAAKMKVPAGLIEKDFWVCYVLDILFHKLTIKNGFEFKGGTCLSKAFRLINRFSEDIDLVLDWRFLGYSKSEPWNDRSNTAQEKFKKDSIERTNAFLKDRLVPELIKTIAMDSGLDADISLGDDEETVLFRYPRFHSLPVILDVIRLEIGPMAAWTPAENATIQSYLSECIPNIIDSPKVIVRAVSPNRTFWEKISILHQEANRSEAKKMPAGYSRHYYDVYMLGQSPVKASALDNFDLFRKVLEFKMKFYRTPWAMFEEAIHRKVCLLPPDYRSPEVAGDYKVMQEMLFGHKPQFTEIIEYLQSLENEINEQYKTPKYVHKKR
jgi:hypothetical protein